MSSGEGQDGWTTVIQPRVGWLDLRLEELWRCRDLIGLFVHRDFVARYKQTVLGPLWYLIQPLLTTVVFTIVFGNIAGISTDGLPKFLFYMAGSVIWGYFADCLNKTHKTFTDNAILFGKVYFPRLAVPVSILISNLVTFTVQFAFFLVFLLYFRLTGTEVNPNYYVLLLPFMVILMAGLGLGLGLIVSSMTTRYRDLTHLVSFGVTLLMYAAPVIYPLSAVSEPYRWLVMANPMTAVLETMRYAFLGQGVVRIELLLYSGGVTVAVLAAGITVFNWVERTFIDTV